ncbi:MAG: hypothetical protein KAU31_15615, partial [Spirochaetaceae bacterium]|nr:hypothetical protein [Spirochaetaceae bacterium]
MNHRQSRPTRIRVVLGALVLFVLGGQAVLAAPGDVLAAGAVAQEVILGENRIEIRGTALPL